MGPESIDVRSGAVTLVGDHWPGGAHPTGSVLLLHGGGQRRFSWHKTGERLAANGWDTYAFDARGHGDSTFAPDGDYSLDAFVADVVAIRRAIGEPLVLVGASLGGMTSLIAEGEIGGIARALVLVDVVARLDPAGIRRIREFMQQAPNGFATLEDVADAIAAYNPHRRRPRSLDGLKKNVRQRSDGRWYWHWDPAFLQGGDEPSREVRFSRAVAAAKRITVPTLLVRGGESDLVTEASLKEMQELIPGSITVGVTSAGHMVAGDDNDVFTQNLEAFLADLK